MTDRDNHLWLQCWRDQHTEFHQAAVNTMLTEFWPSLHLPAGSRIFVPLCGKSLDMLWLAQQGYDVIGVELSPLAVRAFFKENRLLPRKQKRGAFTFWQHGKLSILCGDYFALSAADLGAIDAVYDRAALTALPEDLRIHYVSRLRQIISAKAPVFLLTTEDAEDNATPAQALGVDTEINTLYAEHFHIDLAKVNSVYEGAQKNTDYKVYKLHAKNV